ncbi:hypothetical protein [Streptomonospora nanhaiensis]|uniref:hypothetical protein n=1 Tax=Streptomonospora nanhaiensis TaxID=1323731 RepID=UPI001C386EA4|nr:hypothetical protein [Streptomonospora nanhaiensis]MBV2364229.1 hypothetical protein [Streptomonospora nanhaiensis]
MDNPSVKRTIDDYWINGVGWWGRETAKRLLTGSGLTSDRAEELLALADASPGTTVRLDPASDVTYEVGAGAYPYRIDGLRMSESEASDYLVQRKGYKPPAAFAAVKLARVDACNAAQPRVRWAGPGGFEIDGREHKAEKALAVLMVEYRRTETEAQVLLEKARGRA